MKQSPCSRRPPRAAEYARSANSSELKRYTADGLASASAFTTDRRGQTRSSYCCCCCCCRRHGRCFGVDDLCAHLRVCPWRRSLRMRAVRWKSGRLRSRAVLVARERVHRPPPTRPGPARLPRLFSCSVAGASPTPATECAASFLSSVQINYTPHPRPPRLAVLVRHCAATCAPLKLAL